MKAKTIFGLLVVVFLATASAKAADKSLENMDLEADVLATDAQVEEVNGYAYDSYATQTKIEARATEREAKKTEAKIVRLEKKKKASEQRAKVAADRLAASEKRRDQARERLAKLETEKAQIDSKVQSISTKVASLTDQAKETREQAKQAHEALLKAERKHNDLLRRKNVLAKQIEKNQHARKQFEAKRSLLEKKNHKSVKSIARN